ncbi:MAG TPA: hypothetical protein VGC85_07355 [Chthoniobacterales bacterium]
MHLRYLPQRRRSVLFHNRARRFFHLRRDAARKFQTELAAAFIEPVDEAFAREAFIGWLDARSKALGTKLGRGVSATVKQTARDLVANHGAGILRQVAKVHFRTAHEIAPDFYSAPSERAKWRR